jgi:uncharacterized protein (TIGR00255 family)
MLLSMTGYGSATCELPDMIVRVEVKSLNSRGLDLSIRVPKAYSEKEISLRTQLGHQLQRGKVSIYIDTEYIGSKLVRKAVNKDLLMAYYTELKNIAAGTDMSVENIMPVLLNMNEIMQSPSTEASEEEWQYIDQTLRDAMQKFESFRKAEGDALNVELKSYISNIGEYLKRVEAKKDDRLAKVKGELKEKLDTFFEEGKIDENRFEQELIYYAEKLDITEEIVRLQTHLGYFMETIDEEAAGKKLGFIAQEMGREINTIGSKANDAAIQRDIVLMKEELEKIKEQVLNVL